MKSLWSREPVAILAAVQAILTLVMTFGVKLTLEQTGAILAAAAAILGVVGRQQVAPTAPATPKGNDAGEIGLRVLFLIVALVLFLVVGAIGATWISSSYVFAFLGFGLAAWVLANLVP